VKDSRLTSTPLKPMDIRVEQGLVQHRFDKELQDLLLETDSSRSEVSLPLQA
jgi:hypothetical protein